MRPTKGRIVLFTFPANAIGSFSSENGQTQTVPAVITEVWSEDCVNLRVFTDSNQPIPSQTSVPLKTEHHNEVDGFYWEWPPRE